MFKIDIKFDDISIINVEKEDVFKIKNWINNQNGYSIDDGLNYGTHEFYERYLEYYVSEGEFFLKILCASELMGIIKGRIEFKNPNEVWIMCYMIEPRMHVADISSTIINEFSKHLYENYGICNFYTFAKANNIETLKFWKNNDFEISRVTSNFLEMDSKEMDMLILKKMI